MPKETLTAGSFLAFRWDLRRGLNRSDQLKILVAILQAPMIGRILTHLALQARMPARGHGLRLTRVESGEGLPSVRV